MPVVSVVAMGLPVEIVPACFREPVGSMNVGSAAATVLAVPIVMEYPTDLIKMIHVGSVVEMGIVVVPVPAIAIPWSTQALIMMPLWYSVPVTGVVVLITAFVCVTKAGLVLSAVLIKIYVWPWKEIWAVWIFAVGVASVIQIPEPAVVLTQILGWVQNANLIDACIVVPIIS